MTFPGVLSLTWLTLQYRENDLFLLCDLLVWQLHCLCYACWQLQCLPQSTQDFSLMCHLIGGRSLWLWWLPPQLWFWSCCLPKRLVQELRIWLAEPAVHAVLRLADLITCPEPQELPQQLPGSHPCQTPPRPPLHLQDHMGQTLLCFAVAGSHSSSGWLLRNSILIPVQLAGTRRRGKRGVIRQIIL